VCFNEVARSGSVVSAAETLNMSQPAATKTIQELEAVIGERLFDRSRRKLVLTETGELFHRYTGTSLSALRQGIDALKQARQDSLIRIGALPTVSAQILPQAVQLFTESSLPARTRIITGPNGYLLSLLRVGDVDLVIGRMADPDAIAGFAFEHLYSEQVVFVVRVGHPLLASNAFDLTMIEDYQTLMPPPDSVIRPTVERLLVSHGVSNIRDDIETVSNAFGRTYTRLTDAVWIISKGVVARDIDEGQLALLPVDTAETLGAVGLTTRARDGLSPAAQIFVEKVREVAGKSLAGAG
jgi:LysR family pca operon transcriptional activator